MPKNILRENNFKLVFIPYKYKFFLNLIDTLNYININYSSHELYELYFHGSVCRCSHLPLSNMTLVISGL